MDAAFKYYEDTMAELESDYVYVSGETTKQGTCKDSMYDGKVSVTNYSMVGSESVSQLKAAINIGPVSVAIEADKSVF